MGKFIGTKEPRLKKWDSESARFFIINGLTAMSFSFILPVIPIFLVEHLKVAPALIGLFTVSSAISGIYVSKRIGDFSDRGISDRALFLITVMAIVVSGLGFAFLSHFWQAVFIGVVFMGLARASITQILSMIRKFAVSTGRDATKFNSQMRSSVSMVWVVGPPLAFIVVGSYGFQANFLMAAFIGVCVLVLARFALPNTSSPKSDDKTRDIAPMPLVIWVLGGVVFFANIANSLYITSMPLFVTRELGLSLNTPGLLFGLTAAIEIPIMLLAGQWAARFGILRMLLVAFVSAIAFYISLQFATGLVGLLLIQLFNGIFFGVFVGLGVSLFQDELPSRTGAASAFYTNSMAIGAMCGSTMAGLLAQWWSFKVALLGSLVSVCIALVGLIIYLYSQRKGQLVLSKQT